MDSRPKRGILPLLSDYRWMKLMASAWESQGVSREDVSGRTYAGIESYWPAVFRYAYSILQGDREAALDVTQDTFASALSSNMSFTSVVDTEAWVITIARRRVADYLRSVSRSPSASVSVARDLTTESELRIDLLRTLNALAPNHGEVLILRYVCDLPVSEVARVLELTPKAVEGRLARARRALLSKLTEVGQDD